jgi:hypothetical protein
MAWRKASIELEEIALVASPTRPEIIPSNRERGDAMMVSPAEQVTSNRRGKMADYPFDEQLKIGPAAAVVAELVVPSG